MNNKLLFSFIKGGTAIFFSIIVGTILTFFYRIILARYLGPEQYGLFEMSVTLLGLFTLFSGFGLFLGFQRFIPLYNIKKNYSYVLGFIKTTFYIQIFYSLLISILVILFADKITAFFNFPDIFTNIIYVLAFIIPFKVFTKSYSNYFISYKKALIAKSGVQIIENLVMSLGVFFIIFYSLDIFAVIILFFIANVLTFLFYYINSLKLKIKHIKPEYEYKRWFSYSFPLLFAGIIGFLLNWTDNLIIARYLTQADIGVYGVVFTLAFFLFLFPKLFSSLILPLLTVSYNQNKDEFVLIFKKIRNWTFTLTFIVGIVFIFFPKQILFLFFGDTYVYGASSLQTLSFFFILTSYFWFSEKLLHLEEKTKNILLGDSIVLILNIFLTIFLVQKIGILGAAISSGGTFFLIRFIFYFISKKYIKITNDYVYLLKLISGVLLSLLISYLIVILINVFLTLNIYLNFFLMFLFYFTFVMLFAYFLKLFSEEVWFLLGIFEEKTKINVLWIKKYY